MESKLLRWTGHAVLMEFLGNRPVVRLKRWEDNIKVYLKETDGSGSCPVAGFWY
jgi:hypothetical protein